MKFNILILSIIATQLQIILSKLYVTSPKEVKQQFPNDGMNSTLANFGMYRYGHTQHGVLVIGGLKKQFSIMDNYSTDGCSEMANPFLLEGEELEKNKFKSEFPFFLLVDRGNCTFLQKAQNAEKIGAQLLIVADNNEDDILEEHLLVGNYETGSQHLHMPTIMISTKDANILKKAYYNEDYSRNIINMAFKMKHPNRTSEQVQIEFYFNAFEAQSNEFLEHYYSILDSIGEENIKLIPRYHTWYCISCKKAQNPFQVKDTLQECVSGGRYCANDPDASGMLTGIDVVQQMVRSLCVYETFGQKVWMKSQIEFYRRCVNQRKSEEDLNECYLMVYESIAVDMNLQSEYEIRKTTEQMMELFLQYESCYNDSWITNRSIDPIYWDNEILMEQRELALENDITYTPQLLVNGMKFYGDLQETEATEEFICEAFERDSLPQGCIYFDEEWNRLYGDDGEFGESVSSRLFNIFLIILGSVALVMIFLWFYKRYMKQTFLRDLQSQVSESVNNYYNLQERSTELQQ